MAKITVFLGSVRRGRAGIHVANWVVSRIEDCGHDVTLIDPLDHPDLLVMKSMFKSQQQPSADFAEVREQVNSSDGYIVVSPEYNHGYSGAIKNALDCFLEEYNFKPFGIITYSTGRLGGVRAAEMLRCVTAELGAPAIPISLQVGEVSKTFNKSGELQDDAYNDRLKRMMDEFEWYVEAMAAQRENGTPY